MSHSERKADHLDLCATDDVAFRSKSTLFDEVQLIHDALPELATDAIDLTTHLAGLTLRAPVVIAAMTGGLKRADAVNRDLASVAEELGLAFGFGSMRPLLEQGTTAGYLVRDVAPTAILFGNIGVVQAAQSSTQQLTDLVGQTGVNALCVHLNPAQEVVQSGGDEDFRGGLAAIQRLVEDLPVPIIVKETGCGLSRAVGQRLVAAGVRAVDVGGAGGTSWVGVETLRARAATQRLGELYWDWGIPTAASVVQLQGLELDIIATGGVRHGLDIARALSLGATAGGLARPFLKAWNAGGREEALRIANELVYEIRVAHLLTNSATPDALRQHRPIIGPQLARWMP
jgi:isopentenyl-diphosphate delta-isomerase